MIWPLRDTRDFAVCRPASTIVEKPSLERYKLQNSGYDTNAQ